MAIVHFLEKYQNFQIEIAGEYIIGIPHFIQDYHLTLFIGIDFNLEKGVHPNLIFPYSFGVLKSALNDECVIFDLIAGKQLNKKILNRNRTSIRLLSTFRELFPIKNTSRTYTDFSEYTVKKLVDVSFGKDKFDNVINEILALLDKEDGIEYDYYYQPFFLTKSTHHISLFLSDVVHNLNTNPDPYIFDTLALNGEQNPKVKKLTEKLMGREVEYLPSLMELKAKYYPLKNLGKWKGVLVFENGAITFITKDKENIYVGLNFRSDQMLLEDRKKAEDLVQHYTQKRLESLQERINTKIRQREEYIQLFNEEIAIMQKALEEHISEQNKLIQIKERFV